MKKAIIEFIHVSQSLTIYNSKESPAPGKCNRNLEHMLKCAHDMLTLCKLRGSQLQLFHCLRTTASERDVQDHGISCWGDTPVSAFASPNPQQNCNSDGQLRNETVNLLCTQSCYEDECNLPHPTQLGNYTEHGKCQYSEGLIATPRQTIYASKTKWRVSFK